MIRTVFEVSAETEWDFERQLDRAMNQIGYEKTPSPEQVEWKRDLFEALAEKGIKPSELVEEYREKRRNNL